MLKKAEGRNNQEVSQIKSQSSQDVNNRGGEGDPTRGKQNTKTVWF